jgi:hypothetical protein
LWRMMLLITAGAWGLAVGDAYRWVRGLRAYRRSARPAVLPRQATAPGGTAPHLLMKEEEHGA